MGSRHCTLHWCDGGLREADVALGDVVGRLVLGNLHARAHVALAVEEEGEGARQALAGDTGQRAQQENVNVTATRPVTRVIRGLHSCRFIWLTT